MKQSGIASEHMDRAEISKHNRVRLMQQNKKLMIEIQKLDVIISSIIEKNVSHDFEHLEENQQLKQRYSHEQNLQMKEIARLKQAIKSNKASLAEHKYVEIKNQENQIVYLKRQYDKLASEKYTLIHKKTQKQQALQYHKPLNQQTAQTYDKYKKIKIQNGELKAQVHELEREINKYHKYKELSKTSVPRAHENPEYQFMRIDNQIKNMKKEMGRIEQKWKPKIQSLDREYFGIKSILTEKEEKIQVLEKQLKLFLNKANSLRDQEAVANDRQRVTSIPISPKKRQEMQELLQLARAKSKDENKKINQSKTIKESSKKNKDKMQAVSAKDLPAVDEKKEDKSQENDVLRQSVEEGKASREKLSEAPARPTKIMENIGVGTSFYYDDDC